MTLNELYSEVSRLADTVGTHISVAETSRVCALMWAVLATKQAEEALRVVARGIELAKARS